MSSSSDADERKSEMLTPSSLLKSYVVSRPTLMELERGKRPPFGRGRGPAALYASVRVG